MCLKYLAHTLKWRAELGAWEVSFFYSSRRNCMFFLLLLFFCFFLFFFCFFSVFILSYIIIVYIWPMNHIFDERIWFYDYFFPLKDSCTFPNLIFWTLSYGGYYKITFPCLSVCLSVWLSVSLTFSQEWVAILFWIFIPS